ncbi:MAG: hypothetical protein EOP92_20565, partial [Lysobacteraceae bacterium]
MLALVAMAIALKTASLALMVLCLLLPMRAAYQPMIQATNSPSDSSRHNTIRAREAVFNAIAIATRASNRNSQCMGS